MLMTRVGQADCTEWLNDTSYEVCVWGARGSVACGSPEFRRYGGDTSCVELRQGPATVVFDAGTGLRALGDRLMRQAREDNRPVDIDLLLSHTHLDHVAGLPFFAPFFQPGNRVRVWLGREPGGLAARDTFKRLFTPPFFPLTLGDLKADLIFHDFTPGDTLALPGGLTVGTHPLNHPNGATAFRAECGVRPVCYVTDLEHTPGMLDMELVSFVADADLMFYDATYTDDEYPAHRGWGHSTWQEGLRVSEAAGVKRFVAFHHDPSHDDQALESIERDIQARNRDALVARQGIVLRP